MAVLYIHQIFDAVFYDLHNGRLRRLLAGQGEPALILGEPLFVPQGHIVPLEHAPDGLAVLPENLYQSGQEHLLDALHAHGQHLDAEQVVELVHRQAREGVRLAEDDAAAVQVIITHDALAVVPGPAELPLPEGLVKAVVGVAGDEPDPDLGLFRKETCAKISAFFAYYIHQFPVFWGTFHRQNLCVVDPGVAPQDGSLRLGGDGKTGIGTVSFHGWTLLCRSDSVNSISHFPKERHRIQ